MKKITYLLFFFIALFNTNAQVSRWIDMFSYLDIRHVQLVDNTIYAQANNAIFTYHTQTGEIEKISSINGLSGDPIQTFYYDQNAKKLCVFHQGGLIETIDEQKNVFKIPDLALNTYIPPEKKIINQAISHNNLLYLSTDYGISVFDIINNEFGDTYYFNNGSFVRVNSIAFDQNNIFAATDIGIKYADENANLINDQNWTHLDGGQWHHLVLLNNKLLGVKYNDIFEITTTNLHQILHFNENIHDLKSNNDLIVSFSNKVIRFNTSYIQESQYIPTSNYNYLVNAAINDGQNLYIGSQKYGLLQTPLNTNEYREIHPNCPLYNTPFSVDAQAQKLWVVYGDHDDSYNPYPLKELGVSTYQDNRWTNIKYNQLNTRDICYVKINPSQPDVVFLSSMFDGLLKLKNNTIEILYNQNNSPLLNDPQNPAVGIRTGAIAFDNNLNLWITKNNGNHLLELQNNQTWQVANLNGIFQTSEANYRKNIAKIIVDQNNNIWLGTLYKGIIGYNPSNGNTVKITKGIYPASYTNVKALAIDKNNTLWMGNHESLRILNNPENAFTNSDIEVKPIKIVVDETVQLLMEGQNISSIKVDGSNNKWLGTIGSGVYYLSEDGTKTIFHFNKENSPLPSNDINDISIDGATGIVYFATNSGLVAFKGNATEAGENMDDVYAFPNPVNQQKHDFVSIRGLIKDVHVKIVDVEGNLVYETTSKGGSIDWNLTAFNKYKVASGVYIALITNDDGSQTQTTKILVIK